MKAIETKYHGPTNTRGARVTARDGDGNTARVPYQGPTEGPDTTPEQGHARAVVALCAKMGWTGELVVGWTNRGPVFVWHRPSTRRSRTVSVVDDMGRRLAYAVVPREAWRA